MSRHLGQRAIVIGAGIGGLSAAGALSPYFEDVVVLERDQLPSSAASRAGTPQDRHSHGLLAGGLQALSELFPGFAKDLTDAGAVTVNAFRDIQYERPDIGALPRRDLAKSILCFSRPLIEQVLRQRLAALGNVDLRSQCRATEIVPAAIPLSVRVVDFGSGAATFTADLIIDASGRGVPTLALLDALGWERPHETVVGIDISYTTVRLQRPAATPPNAKLLYTFPNPPDLVQGALLQPIEDGQCLVTLAGWGTTEHPESWDDFLAALRRLQTPTIYDAIRDLPPPDGLKHFVFDESRWRHFEQLGKLPHGVLPVADALCRFNPVYGQGMSIAARQAKLLHDTLARVAKEPDPITALQAKFMTEVAPLLQAPWVMGVNADFAFPGTRGQRPENYEESRQFEAALFQAAVADPVVQRAFSDVVQLIEPFELFQDPDIQIRIKARAEARPDRIEA
jgi:2-polyprenyl-6-methoxyphenol hydroxylase-like FAD-dependent oxidoreductase